MVAALLTLLAVAVTATQLQEDTPVQKVIDLLTDLKTQIENEGTAEAGTYDQFACFCKDKTATRSSAITTGRDSINSLSAEIGTKSSSKDQKATEMKDRKKDEQVWTKELADEQARCDKEKEIYDAKVAELEKALSSLSSAISAMESSKPTLLAIRQTVEHSLALADALNLIADKKRKEVSTFLQSQAAVDPTDPTYKYHSQGIIDVLTNLQTQFNDEKTETDDEWTKADGICTNNTKALNDKLDANTLAMDTLTGDIAQLGSEIAQARESLIQAESTMKDDQLYLKDLTERCETKAKEWDQRSSTRADELSALSGALEVLNADVKWRDDEVNNRTFFIQSGGLSHPPDNQKIVSISQHRASPSFIQESTFGGRSYLRGAHVISASQAKQSHAVELLHSEGGRLHSQVLATVAVHVASDPFVKVKTLIQKLIERLLAESAAEAEKKGFCDEQIGKAKQDRDYRLADTAKLDLEIQELELKQDELTEENVQLAEALTQLRYDLGNATELRASEKEQNVATIKTAREGLTAVREAINILKIFYKQAAKGKVLLQASPVDEDTTGAGFDGAYTGKQDSSKGIIGMLEVIESDFDRTTRFTQTAEKTALEEFVKFERVSETDISAKSTQQVLNEEELQKIATKHAEKTDDLGTAQGLLDDALATLEDLKPTCIDTAMSYADRVARRDEEIAALNKALCILAPDGTEPDCPAS